MVQCVECGRNWHEDERGGRGGWTTVNGEPVCWDKCQWEYAHDLFKDFLKKHNIEARVQKLAQDPKLDDVISLKRELVDAVDVDGVTPDTNLVNSVIGPLADLEDVLKRGLPEYVGDCLKELKEGVDHVLHGTPIFDSKDSEYLKKFMDGNTEADVPTFNKEDKNWMKEMGIQAKKKDKATDK